MRRTRTLLAIVAIALLAASPASARKRRAARSASPLTSPIAVDDSYTTGKGSPLITVEPGVLLNDTLNGGSLVSYGMATGDEQTSLGAATATAQGGTIALGADGAFTYTPASSFSGNDTFVYRLAAGAASDTATVTITVIAPPNASNDSYTTAQNTALDVSAVSGVLDNDTLNGGSLSGYGASTGTEQTTLGSNTPTAQGGTVRVSSNGSLTYTPANGFSGSDSFRYRLTNGGGSDTATVTITVTVAADYDYEVTSPGFFFRFTPPGGEPSAANPTITLTRGRTYKFKINTSSIHPFEILGVPQGSVTNNNISQGTLTFTVPNSADDYNYWCPIHEFGGTFDVP